MLTILIFHFIIEPPWAGVVGLIELTASSASYRSSSFISGGAACVAARRSGPSVLLSLRDPAHAPSGVTDVDAAVTQTPVSGDLLLPFRLAGGIKPSAPDLHPSPAEFPVDRQ